MITEPTPRSEVAVDHVFAADFRAMGCGVEVLVHGGGVELLDMARRRIEHFERCWTRFDASSDLCRINAAGGGDVMTRNIRRWIAFSSCGTAGPNLHVE